jgi:predicted secreted hydrolase
MQRFVLFGLLLLLVACAAPAQPQVSASLAVSETLNTEDSAGYARAIAPRPFVFPADHGPHQEYQIEWWYYTGNLRSADGRRFGYQFTIFRRGLTPTPAERPSAWATSNIYMAHLALSDIAGGQFYNFDRFSRDGAGLAGATGEPFRVFLDNWSAEGSGPEGMTVRLQAEQAPVAIDLTLVSQKPPVLQGDRGLSQKGREAGNASYYYSLTRMATTGQIRLADQAFNVEGTSWFDHEWSTSALDAGVIGWDWFSLQLDDGREIMFFQLRQADGGQSPFTSGTLVERDGTTRPLAAEAVVLRAEGEWRSPRSGAAYPARWRMQLPAEGLDLTITPLLADQELAVAVVYWEGAVAVGGRAGDQTVTGAGYVELTGYVETGDVGVRGQ